jgi:hypothetical protein
MGYPNLARGVAAIAWASRRTWTSVAFVPGTGEGKDSGTIFRPCQKESENQRFEWGHDVSDPCIVAQTYDQYTNLPSTLNGVRYQV